MIPPRHDNVGVAKQTDLKALMMKNGITNVPIDCFHVGDYKYTNLEDAIAQAKRMSAEKD